MSRLPLMLSVLVFSAGVTAMLAAQPPKEPTHDGKTLSEWVKQLTEGKEDEHRKAADSLRAMAQHSDVVIEKMFATGCKFAAEDMAFTQRGRLTNLLTEIGPAAVPALIQGLWSEDEATRRFALLILADIGADAHSAGPTIASLLSNSSDATRRTAIRPMASVGGRAAIPALTKIAEGRDADSRVFAAQQLLSLGADASVVIPVLTAALKNAEQRDEAALLLTSIGPEGAVAVPAIVALLPEAEGAFLAFLVNTLGSIGPGAKEAVPALKKALADGKKIPPHIRAMFGLSLWKISRDPDAGEILRSVIQESDTLTYLDTKLWRVDSGPESLALLNEQLKSDKPAVAIRTAKVIGSKSKDAIPLLGKLLAHKEPKVRAEAVVALVQLGSQAKEALPALQAAIKDDAPQIAFWATVAVCRLDPKAENVAALAGYLGDPSPEIRRDAVEMLGLLGSVAKPAVAKLTLAMADTNPNLRITAAVSLWRIEQHPLALPAVVEMLQSPNQHLRTQAVVELGETFGPDAKSAVSAMVKRLFDPFAWVRSSTAEAIGRVGPDAKHAAPALFVVLDADEPAMVHSAACEALGLINPTDKERAATILKQKLDHYDPLVRVHAALALHRIAGDKAGEKVAERGLSSRTYRVRITAAEALWRMNKDERVVPLLVRMLEESNVDEYYRGENERYMAVRALGRIGAPAKAAVPELLKLVNHHDAALVMTAAAALKAISPEPPKKPDAK